MRGHQLLIAKMPGPGYSLATSGRGPLRQERANVVAIQVINVNSPSPHRFRLRYLSRVNRNNRTDIFFQFDWVHVTTLDEILQALGQYFLRQDPTRVQLLYADFTGQQPRYKLHEGEYWTAAQQAFSRTVKRLTGW